LPPSTLAVDDLDYDLPPTRIAQQPRAERAESQLLWVEREGQGIEDWHVGDLPKLLRPALFVFNNTRVMPARLRGTKPSGGKVELLLIEMLNEDTRASRWLAWGRSMQTLKAGDCIDCGNSALTVRFITRRGPREVEVEIDSARPIHQVLDEVGELALPPYIRRAPQGADRERYQTVYAETAGANAAPTAGLHFTHDLLAELRGAGHQLAYLTLHVGPGTFAPVESHALNQHPMHEERYEISDALARAYMHAKEEGRPIVAVGTTVLRALESALTGNSLRSGAGRTRLFIYPPYKVKSADMLFTNFHLPKSTLLALVMAFAEAETVKRAYAHAIDRHYRFFSYGDATLFTRKEHRL